MLFFMIELRPSWMRVIPCLLFCMLLCQILMRSEESDVLWIVMAVSVLSVMVLFRMSSLVPAASIASMFSLMVLFMMRHL